MASAGESRRSSVRALKVSSHTAMVAPSSDPPPAMGDLVEGLAGVPEEGPSPDGAAADSPARWPTVVTVASAHRVRLRVRPGSAGSLPEAVITPAPAWGQANFGPIRFGVPAAAEHDVGHVSPVLPSHPTAAMGSRQEGRVRQDGAGRRTPPGPGSTTTRGRRARVRSGPAEVLRSPVPSGAAVGPDGTILSRRAAEVRRGSAPTASRRGSREDDRQRCPPPQGRPPPLSTRLASRWTWRDRAPTAAISRAAAGEVVPTSAPGGSVRDVDEPAPDRAGFRADDEPGGRRHVAVRHRPRS